MADSPDFMSSGAALASAVRWVLGLTGGHELENISFGQRQVNAKGYYWWAVTYQRWNNALVDSRGDSEAMRVEKVVAAWIEAFQ